VKLGPELAIASKGPGSAVSDRVTRGKAASGYATEGGIEMTAHRAQQQPDEFRADLNPDYEAGENHGPPSYATRSAEEIKALHEILSPLRGDELRRIPVLAAGSRLEQGTTYLDLRFPQRGEFTAMGFMEAGPDDWLVPKSDMDHELWHRLLEMFHAGRPRAEARNVS
jgi:hypothetical protein